MMHLFNFNLCVNLCTYICVIIYIFTYYIVEIRRIKIAIHQEHQERLEKKRLELEILEQKRLARERFNREVIEFINQARSRKEQEIKNVIETREKNEKERIAMENTVIQIQRINCLYCILILVYFVMSICMSQYIY